MIITDVKNGKVLAQLPIGEKSDGVAFDPNLKCAYSSNGDQTMTVVKKGNDGKYRVLENFSTQTGARTITVNTISHHIYLSAASFEPAEDGKKPKLLPGTFVVLDIVSN